MIPAYLPALFTAVSAGLKFSGMMGQGNAALAAGMRKQQLANYEAQQLDVNAKQAFAASQRAAYFKGQEGDLVLSRMTALAAASGAGASDPTILNLKAQILARKAYNMEAALYGGEEQARGMREAAKAKRYGGELAMADAKSAKSSYKFAAMSSLFSGGAGMFERYAQDLAPQSPSPVEERYVGYDEYW